MAIYIYIRLHGKMKIIVSTCLCRKIPYRTPYYAHCLKKLFEAAFTFSQLVKTKVIEAPWGGTPNGPAWDFTFCLQRMRNVGSSTTLIDESSCAVVSAWYLKVYWETELHRRLKKSNKKQQYADNYLQLNYSTCFGRPSRPSSGVHKTVVAASGTDHTVKYKSWTRSIILTNRL